jgi:hypothetical protein
MTVRETLAALQAPSRTPAQAFAILQAIARMLGEKPEDPGVQALLIRALEHREDFAGCSPLLNALLRETGLYPYAEPGELSTRDRLAFEFHRPEGQLADRGMVFHRVQAQVYWRLMDGENIILSAPTSFGKSRGRDFAAWLGLTPRQHSSGGKEKLGRTSKMGERSLRRLLILGASPAANAAARNPTRTNGWLGRMLARKPRMLVTVALANKMARVVWALMAHGGSYRTPAAAV